MLIEEVIESLNSFFYRRMNEVFPTPGSPIIITLNNFSVARLYSANILNKNFTARNHYATEQHCRRCLHLQYAMLFFEMSVV